ncbi:Imm58 family immunity protein [Paraglaciecola sp. 2405UD69-4]|uniref:Imm58 family immunity protein n=1 Tax=Paraglaciecola sp. 2405UD69-4 TaxID=3391836 RepID=UPI0039C959F4
MFKNKWKLSFFVAVTLLILSNLFWFYAVVDQAVSYSYLSTSNDDANNSIKSLGELIVKGADKYTQKDILHLLRQVNPDEFIVEKGNVIITEHSKFTFENGKLARVE